jgi:hypothetical protein
MSCPICRRRRAARLDPGGLCRTCRAFVTEYVDTGRLRPRPVPAAADVGLVMRQLGVSQRRAVLVLGGQP